MDFILDIGKRGIVLENAFFLSLGTVTLDGHVPPDLLITSFQDIKKSIDERIVPDFGGSPASRWLAICEEGKYNLLKYEFVLANSNRYSFSGVIGRVFISKKGRNTISISCYCDSKVFTYKMIYSSI